jgi:polysaccharide biosynthesis transport protein
MVASVVVVTGIAIATSSSQEHRYESKADVFLSGARNLPSNIADIAQYAVDPERAAKTQAKLALTPEVARRALLKAKVTDLTPNQLISNTSIDNPESTDILQFTVTDTDRDRVEVLATSYAQAYTEYRTRLDTSSIVEARTQIEKRLEALEESKQTRSELYRSMAEQDQRLRTQEALQGGNVSLIKPGSNARQTQPQTRRNAILGGILGLIIGLGLAYLRDALNTRVRTSEEVQDRLALPLLARVPELPKNLAGGKAAMLEDPHAPEMEAFRILATNLGFVNLDRGAKSLMVTSAERGEGKSTTMANTSVALARAGMRVVLVDLDLKRPGVRRLFGLEHDLPGVTSIAAGMASAADVKIEIPLADQVGPDDPAASAARGSLHVIPTGPIPPDTADFVASPRLGEVIDQLSADHDIVLVDAPPILQISDAMALTGKVDALMVVTRLAVIRRPTLNELRRVLDAAPIAKLGFVLIGVHEQGGYYGYGYGPAQSNGTARGKRARVKAG